MIPAASPKIEVALFGSEPPMVFCDMRGVRSTGIRQRTDSRLPLSYHLPRPATASCSYVLAMVLQGMTDESSLHWSFRRPHSAPGPMAAFGLRLQLDSLCIAGGTCAPYRSP